MKCLPCLSLVILLFASCRNADTPNRVAATFLELYAVRVDQESALELAADAAAENLRKEIADAQSARASGEDFSSDPRRQAPILTARSASENSDRTWEFGYEITVRPKDSEPFTRKVTLTVADRDGKWRVVDYRFSNESTSPTQ